jgi:hypothetical protein
MDTATAARNWAETWTRAWPQRDAGAIAALYREDAPYRSTPFRPADTASGYLHRELPREEQIECWFGEPLVMGDRAAVKWWGTWVEDGLPQTYAGTTLLRFDAEGKVVDHCDYADHVDRREPPYDGW